MSLTGLIITIASAVIAVAAVIYLLIWYRRIKPAQMKQLREEAQKEAEVIKQKKLLEVKEKFLNKKAELEKEVQQRNQQIQQSENRIKQRELSLNQRQDELNRRKNEQENERKRMEQQQALLQKREEELSQRLENLINQERTQLEKISGLTAEEAKERLIETLKDEAKTDAASYIN